MPYPATGMLIVITAYGGSIKNGCVQSAIELQKMAAAKSIPTLFKIPDSAELPIVRNIYASMLIELGNEFSHLLFIDNDVQFKAQTVERMRSADKPLIGCPYPARSTSQSDFVVSYVKGTKPEGDLCKVVTLGMGLTLIRKDCLEQLRDSGRLTSRVRQGTGLNGPAYGFFDPIYGKKHYSEDQAFCHRWREFCGGEVWALTGHTVGHIGQHTFRGSFKP